MIVFINLDIESQHVFSSAIVTHCLENSCLKFTYMFIVITEFTVCVSFSSIAYCISYYWPVSSESQTVLLS